MTVKLAGGDAFPEFELRIAGGGAVSVPQDLDAPLTILLFYRGHW